MGENFWIILYTVQKIFLDTWIPSALDIFSRRFRLLWQRSANQKLTRPRRRLRIVKYIASSMTFPLLLSWAKGRVWLIAKFENLTTASRYFKFGGSNQFRWLFVKMTRTRPMSLKNRAIGMFEAGMKWRGIARKLNVPKSSVCTWVTKFLREGSVDRAKVPTRPRKTSAATDRRLLDLSKSNRFLSASQLRAEWDEPVSEQTVRNRLHEQGLKAYRSVIRPLLSPAHRSARLKWTMAWCHFRGAQWDRIVFTDESRFLLRPTNGRLRVWRGKNERYNAIENALMCPFKGNYLCD